MGSIGAGKISNSTIDRTPFKNIGGGQWELDIPGVGGASILDETDSSRAGYGTGTAYSVSIWDKDYNIISNTLVGSLNAGKAMAKDTLKRQG